MQRPSGTAAVRLSIWMLFFAAFAVSLVQPVSAGTQENPEIQDPAGDQAVLGEIPGIDPVGFAGSDILAGWISGETATEIHLFISTSGTFADGTGGPYHYEFHLTVDEVEYIATIDSGNPPTAGGVATAVLVDGGVADLTVPKANIGNPTAGTLLTGLFIAAGGGGPEGIPGGLIQDRAPDEGNGQDYTATGGGAAPADPDDTDGDGLNDTWEMQYFGDLNQTAEDDPDGDGLTNGQEEALGTDPTKADTDGDGCDDKVDSAPLDPDAGCESSTTTTTTSGTTTSGTATGTGTGTGTSTRTSTLGAGTGGGGQGNVENLDDAVERLESDLGYVGLSAGGFLAVLVLCIIGLAVRWSL